MFNSTTNEKEIHRDMMMAYRFHYHPQLPDQNHLSRPSIIVIRQDLGQFSSQELEVSAAAN
jgi:hypothetical protein